jgi:hypothetical protein
MIEINQKGQSKMLSQNTIIQMFDKDTLICEDTLLSFVENNSDDEEVIDALHLLSHFVEIDVVTGQGVFTLKVKD